MTGAVTTSSLDPLSRVTPPTADRPAVAQRALATWARVAIGAFYRRVRISGSVPQLDGRPVVLAVNHSNALGDIALLLTVVPRFPRFLAAASWWRHGPARLLFRLGRVLPVGRRGDGATADLNGGTFAACHEALAAADHIAIFPEGKLNSGKDLLPFKTGAARIALSAASEARVRGVVIAPVALAYEDRGRVGSEVVVRFGEPIEMDSWVGTTDVDPVATVREVTELLQRRLADALRVATVEVRDAASARATERRRDRRRLVALSPVAAAGVVANSPAIVPIAVGSRFVRDDGWQATTKGVAATALLPLTWTGTGILAARRWGARRALVLVAAGAGSGWAALGYAGLLRDLTP